MTKTHDTPGKTGQNYARLLCGILAISAVTSQAGCSLWDFRSLETGCTPGDREDTDCYPANDGACKAGESTPPSQRKDLVCDNGVWRSIKGGFCYSESDCANNLKCLEGPSAIMMKPGKCGMVDDTMMTIPPKMCVGDGDCVVEETCVAITETARECRKKTGARCEANGQCLPGSGCEDKVCKVAILGFCNNTPDCTAKATCELNKCKLTVGQMCAMDEQCTAAQVCNGSRCKSDMAGEACMVNEDCVGSPTELVCNVGPMKCEIPKCTTNCPAGTSTKDPSICLSKEAVPISMTDAEFPTLTCTDKARNPPRKSGILPGVEAGLRCVANDKATVVGGAAGNIFPIPAGEWRTCPEGTYWIRTTDKNGNLMVIAGRGHREDNPFTGEMGDIGGGIHGY